MQTADGSLIAGSRLQWSDDLSQPSLQTSIQRLVIVAAKAGMSVQQMIDLLNAGLNVEGLLLLIELRLKEPRPAPQPELPIWKM